MRMKRAKKVEEVKKIREDLRRSEASFVLDYRGLKVTELTELRKMLREEGAKFRVVKNSLAHLAIKETEIKDLSQFFSGCSGIIFAERDSLASARIIKKFIGEHPHFRIKGGALDKNILKSDEVRRLGDMLPREVLLTQVLAGIQFPSRKLLGTLSAPLNNLVLLLSSILEKKKEIYQ